MDYSITATIKEIFPPLSGTNNKGDWKKQSALVESDERGFKTELLLYFWNERVKLIEELGVGEERTFHFNLKSRKSNVNYFTEASVWKVTQ